MREHSDDAVKPLSPRAREALGRMHAELGRESYHQAQLPQPTALDAIPGALGLDVLLLERGDVRPWVTHAVCLVAACSGAVAWWNHSDYDDTGREFLSQLGFAEANVAPASAGLLGMLSIALESAFHPGSSLWLLLGGLWLLHTFGSAAEQLLGHARALALFLGGLLAAGVAQLALLPVAEVQPLFLVGATAASVVFVVLRAPHARVGVLLGFGFSLLRLNGDPWLRLPLWLWGALGAGAHLVYISALDAPLLSVQLAPAAIGLAAAAPALLRRSPAQPSPSTRL